MWNKHKLSFIRFITEVYFWSEVKRKTAKQHKKPDCVRVCGLSNAVVDRFFLSLICNELCFGLACLTVCVSVCLSVCLSMDLLHLKQMSEWMNGWNLLKRHNLQYFMAQQGQWRWHYILRSMADNVKSRKLWWDTACTWLGVFDISIGGQWWDASQMWDEKVSFVIYSLSQKKGKVWLHLYYEFPR